MRHEFVVDIPGLELGLQSTGKMDAAGVDGEQNIVRPVPDNRGTLNFSWARDNHRVSIFNRHIGSFQVLSHDDYLANPNTADINKSFGFSKNPKNSISFSKLFSDTNDLKNFS